MKRVLLTIVAAAAGALAVAVATPAPDAQAVVSAQVVGTYKLKLRGDGWWRGASTPYSLSRVNGWAYLVLTRSIPDDGKLKVAIQVDSATSLVGVATPTPDFSGTGILVGDSMTVIGSGAPTYVNAIQITFLKGGAKVAGHWMAAFPPSDVVPDGNAAGGFAASFTGRRANKNTSPSSSLDTLNR
jgi:hypothetical protein